MANPPHPSGKRIKTQYVGVYFRYGKGRMCPDGKPDKCFDITYKDVNGKFIFEKVGWRSEGYTIQDALELRGIRIRERRHPELYRNSNLKEPLPVGITVNDAWEAFKQYWLPNLKEQYTIEYAYESYIKPSFGTTHILSITNIDIENFRQFLLKTLKKDGKQLTSLTVLKILGVFKRIVNKSFELKILDGKNPFSGISFQIKSASREKYLTQKEADLIFDGLQFISCDLYYISRISLYTGMRLNEILDLHSYDVNIDQGIIYIKDGKTGSRIAYIPEAFKSEFEKILPKEKSELLFKQKNGEKLKRVCVSNQFARFIENTGLNSGKTFEQKIVFHTFRHTFCSWLAIAGVPLYTIAKLAGHKTITMTQRYAKLSPDVQKEALNRLVVI